MVRSAVASRVVGDVQACVYDPASDQWTAFASQALMRSGPRVPDYLLQGLVPFLHVVYPWSISPFGHHVPCKQPPSDSRRQLMMPRILSKVVLPPGGSRHQGPSDAGQFVCQSDDSFVAMSARYRRTQSSSEGVCLPMKMQEARSCAVNDQSSHIAGSALTDSEKRLPAAGGVFGGNKGLGPSQAARSRALRNCRPSPAAVGRGSVGF